jgi:hypothetical protein
MSFRHLTAVVVAALLATPFPAVAKGLKTGDADEAGVYLDRALGLHGYQAVTFLITVLRENPISFPPTPVVYKPEYRIFVSLAAVLPVSGGHCGTFTVAVDHSLAELKSSLMNTAVGILCVGPDKDFHLEIQTMDLQAPRT